MGLNAVAKVNTSPQGSNSWNQWYCKSRWRFSHWNQLENILTMLQLFADHAFSIYNPRGEYLKGLALAVE